MNKPSHLNLKDDSYIAYHKFESQDNKKPFGIIFLGGFRSDMEGTKALFLEKTAQELDIDFIRFDYFGHGKSSEEFTKCNITTWKENVISVLDNLTDKKQIIVGSSLGGWLMQLATLERSDKIAALLGIASAPDFTEELMWDIFDEDARKQLTENGIYQLPTNYCNSPTEEDPYPITMQLIEDGRKNLLLNRDSINIHCPVRFVHGLNDEDVPFDFSLRTAKKMTSNDVHVHYVKSADHRMSDDVALNSIKEQLISLVSSL